MHHELHSYLRMGLEKGYPNELLIRSLRRTGYHEGLIRETLAEVKQEMANPKHPLLTFAEVLFALVFLFTIALIMIFAFVPVLT